MLHNFLANNRDALLQRCGDKVAQRHARGATQEQLKNGLPMFLSQLERTLIAEESGQAAESIRISGPAGGDDSNLSEMGISAIAHGKELLSLGYTVDQVVHDYGDMCQAITDLAVERDAPFGVNEFRTLNRCLDNAIASAVTEFSAHHDRVLKSQGKEQFREILGSLAHELRNSLGTAMLAASAIEAGSLPMGGATGSVLKRSHAALKMLVGRALEDFRGLPNDAHIAEVFDVTSLIADAHSAMALHAPTTGKTIEVLPVELGLMIRANRERLLGALVNLLHNGLKFSQPETTIRLSAVAVGQNIHIQVADHCGGLPAGSAQTMFSPFSQRSADVTGLGIGLSIARHNIETDAGTLTVVDVPGIGCIFTICLPRCGWAGMSQS